MRNSKSKLVLRSKEAKLEQEMKWALTTTPMDQQILNSVMWLTTVITNPPSSLCYVAKSLQCYWGTFTQAKKGFTTLKVCAKETNLLVTSLQTGSHKYWQGRDKQGFIWNNHSHRVISPRVSHCRVSPQQSQWSCWCTSSPSPTPSASSQAGSEHFIIKVAMVQRWTSVFADWLSWLWYDTVCVMDYHDGGDDRQHSWCWSPAPRSQSRDSRWWRRRRQWRRPTPRSLPSKRIRG